MATDLTKNPDFDNLYAGGNAANENRSPSFSPPLLDSVASSGSPAFNNRRNGSTGEKGRKDREERMKMIRERQEQDHERRMSELRAAQEREERIRQLKEAEREKRIKDHREREINRRHAVEERRKALEMHETEKRQQIMAKYKEYEDKLSQSNRSKRPVYAFGSSTPRTLAYLEHLDNAMKVYNTRLQSTTAPPGGDGTTDTVDGNASTQKRAISAVNLNRRPLSSKRPGSVMTMSMHVSNNSPPMPHHIAHNDLLSPNESALASATSMTASFAAGESRIVSNIKNVRLKPHPPSASRSQSTPRHRPGLSSAASSATPTRKMQESMKRDVQARVEVSSPKPRPPPPSS